MDKPSIEINLIGTGGGYGESLLIHLCNGEWIVIDSCIDPNTRTSLPLIFLRERSVDLKKVKLIICTHWHDDHIGGISTLLEFCSKAKFSFARVNDLKKFLQFVSLDYQKLKSAASNSSTIEFNRCLELLQNSKRTAVFASIDRLLYSSMCHEYNAEVYALSPSDKCSQIFDEEISQLIKDYGPTNKKLTKYSPNERSVVILLCCGSEVALCGSDLEVNQDQELGWLDIINNSLVANKFGKAGYIKIPHHGSKNGYLDKIWNVLVKKNPIGTMTPWNRKTKLPEREMVEKYKALTSKLFITSQINLGNKPKKRDSKITKMIKEFNPTLREIKYHYGVVTTKFEIGSKEESRNGLTGTAIEL